MAAQHCPLHKSQSMYMLGERAAHQLKAMCACKSDHTKRSGMMSGLMKALQKRQ